MSPSRREVVTWLGTGLAGLIFPDFLFGCTNPPPPNPTREGPLVITPTETPEATIFSSPDTPTFTPTLVLEPTSTEIPSPTPTPPLVVYTGELKNRKITTATNTIPTAIAKESLSLADQFICRGNPAKPNVALTFDDGWWPEQIAKFIEVIKKTNTPLTIFLAGQAIDAIEKAEVNKSYRGLIKQLYELGCEFGCHSYAHERDFAYRSVDFIVDSINQSQTALDNALGKHVPYRFVRPPYGDMSWNIVEALKKTGLKGVIWTLSGEGTSPAATPASIHDRIAGNSANGFITLQHFLEKDILALEPIIYDLRAKGLNPTTLTNTL